MLRRICLLGGAAFLLFLGGCSVYVEDYQYSPRPALAQLPSTQPDQATPFSVMATIIGVRHEDSKEMLPSSVEVRMRLENTGSEPVEFDPRTLDLINGSLVKFPPPIARPPEPFTVDPGENTVISAFFPFPPGSDYGNTDLESLQLRWTIQVGKRPTTQAVFFRRIFQNYYYNQPYWTYPPYGYGSTVVVRRRY